MAFRSCIGCRAVVAKEELVRLVEVDGKIVVDERSRLPGRGAYVHRRMECIRKSLNPKLLGHRLRKPGVSLDTTALARMLTER